MTTAASTNAQRKDGATLVNENLIVADAAKIGAL